MTRRSTDVIVPWQSRSVAEAELARHARCMTDLRQRVAAAKASVLREVEAVLAAARTRLPPPISSRLTSALRAVVTAELERHAAPLVGDESLSSIIARQQEITNLDGQVCDGFRSLVRLAGDLTRIVATLAPKASAPASSYHAPLITFASHPKTVLTEIVRTILSHQLAAPGLTAAVSTNLARAFGLDPEDKSRSLPSPDRLEGNGLSAAALVLEGTPLLDLLLAPVGLTIDDESRFRHTHLVASPGWGKTQYLQSEIASFLERPDPPSLVVIDSQGDMLDKIARLSCFAPGQGKGGKGRLAHRLVIIDPRDVAHPPALNLFARNRSRLSRYDAATNEMIANGVIELYETIYGAILGAEPTQMQQLVSRMLTRLILTIPGATIITLRNILEDPAPFQSYIDRLPGDAGHFLRRHLTSEQYRETRQQILRRLWGILEQPTFARMLSVPELKLDLFDCLQSGKIVLVNTAIDFLRSERSAVMGRIFIALTLQATLERAGIPPSRRRSAFLIVDEAHQYLDRSCEQMLAMARKYRVGMIVAHQNLSQLSPGLAAALASNTAIHLAGGVSDRDAHTLARDMRTTPDMLLGLRKGTRHSELAVHLSGVTPAAVPVTVRFGTLEAHPRMTDSDYHIVIERNRRRVATTSTPGRQRPVPPPRTRPQPVPRPAPRIVPRDPDDWVS